MWEVGKWCNSNPKAQANFPMRIVKVTYTAKSEFVEQNIANIGAVMTALKAEGHPGMWYHCCLGPDGETFTHTSFFENEGDQKILNDLPQFQYFQTELKAHGLDAPPKQELLTLVGSTRELFG